MDDINQPSHIYKIMDRPLLLLETWHGAFRQVKLKNCLSYRVDFSLTLKIDTCLLRSVYLAGHQSQFLYQPIIYFRKLKKHNQSIALLRLGTAPLGLGAVLLGLERASMTRSSTPGIRRMHSQDQEQCSQDQENAQLELGQSQIIQTIIV